MANSLSPFVDTGNSQFSRQFDIETIGGDQRQRLAEMLRSNMLNQPQGQMVSGWYVAPNWTQYAANLANTAVGVIGGKMLQEERSKKLSDALDAFKGVPVNSLGTENNASMAEGSTPIQYNEQTPLQKITGNVMQVEGQTPANPDIFKQEARRRPLTQDEQDMAMLNLASVDPTMAGIYGNLQAARAKRAYDEEQRTLDRQARFDLARENMQGRMDLARMTAGLAAANRPEPLVAVVNNDGNPVMVPRSQAVGMTPFNAQTAGTAAGSPGARARDATDAVSIVLKAAPLVRQSTSSGIGAGIDWLASGVGYSPKGADVAAQLKVLGGALVSKMPKMSGPQSDKDVNLYKEMAGKLGDPTVPTSQKEAALQTIYDLNAKYAGAPEQTLNFEPSVMPGVGKAPSTSSKW